jgi:hypothetical protein
MSRVSGSEATTAVWVHEVCRLWTAGVSTSSNSNGQINDNAIGKGQCAACGRGDGKSLYAAGSKRGRQCRVLPSTAPVRCAAVGCHVAVHPMCALVTSLQCQSMKDRNDGGDGVKENDDLSGVRARDVDLCEQFTLTYVTVRGTTDAFGKDPGVNRTETLPVIFCGIHNPKREYSFYGLPPGGKHLDDSTYRIPRCKEPTSV